VLGDVLVSPFCEDERFSALPERDKNSLERTPAKAYGTTFIAAVFTADFCFVLKLGDGNVNLISSDDILSPDELCDEALSFNCTTSLCMDDADMLFCRYFREISHGNKPCAVILTSDGVINSFPNIAAYHSFIRNIHEAFTEEDGESAKAELEDALINISERGSGDDMSVAIIAPPPKTEAL
jgi:serine/threonine protein phosphatase PrpC